MAEDYFSLLCVFFLILKAQFHHRNYLAHFQSRAPTRRKINKVPHWRFWCQKTHSTFLSDIHRNNQPCLSAFFRGEKQWISKDRWSVRHHRTFPRLSSCRHNSSILTVNAVKLFGDQSDRCCSNYYHHENFMKTDDWARNDKCKRLSARETSKLFSTYSRFDSSSYVLFFQIITLDPDILSFEVSIK